MNTDNKITQKIMYPAFVNRLADVTEVIVPDLDIDVPITGDAIAIAKYLVQREIDGLYDKNKKVPSPRILSQAEVIELLKYGQELISLEVELQFHV